MHALITGITGLRNRGVEALVVPTVEQLHQRQPDLATSVLTMSPDYDALRLQPLGATPIYDYLREADGQRIKRTVAQLSRIYKPLAPNYQSVVRSIRTASIVIASGGDVFSSDYNALNRHLQPLQLALDAGVPVAFLAQSIGPFKTKAEADAWSQVAMRSKLVTVREKLSYNYVTKDLGLSPDLVKLTADPAFLLIPPSAQQVARMLSCYGITDDRPIIAVAPSQAICRYAVQNYDHHLNVWCQVINLMVDELGAQVLIIPHVQETDVNNDDRVLATNLLKRLDYKPQVRLAGANHSAGEFKGLISACDMVVAERMHPAIAGLSSGVCTLPVGYSVKAEGIMADLLGNDAIHNGLLISIQQFLDANVACSTIRAAWDKRQIIANQLAQALPQAKQNAASNFDMIAEILK